MKCVDYCGEHYIKKSKKMTKKKNSKAKRPSKSTYNPLLQVDYPLFQKSVPIGFVLLSIPTTMQNLKNFRRRTFIALYINQNLYNHSGHSLNDSLFTLEIIYHAWR